MDQARTPIAILNHFFLCIHEHFVHQHQDAKPFLGRQFQKLFERALGRRGAALLCLPLGVKNTQPTVARDLVGQHAPRVLEPPRLAGRIADQHTFFDIQLVEA